MMTVHYTLIFGFLILEICIYILLIIPLPYKQRKVLLHWLTSSPLAKRLNTIQTFLLFLVLVFFLDSVRMMHETRKEHAHLKIETNKDHHHHGDILADQKLHVKIFYSERNVYLTGFTLFVSFVLNRLICLLKDLCCKEEELEKLNEKSKLKQKTDEKKEEIPIKSKEEELQDGKAINEEKTKSKGDKKND